MRKGPIGLSELAELESINPTMLSRITAHLTDDGPARTHRRPRRQARRHGSPRPPPGGALRERIHRERTEALAAHVRSWTAGERELLWRALPVLEELAERLGESRP